MNPPSSSSSKKVRLQIQGEGASAAGSKLNMFTMAKHIVKTEGPSGLFAGVSASLARQCVYSGARFGLYDAFKQVPVLLRTPSSPFFQPLVLTINVLAFMQAAVEPDGSLPFHKKVAGGLFSGALGSFIANPLDLSLVRMQADSKAPVAERRNYKSVFDAVIRVTRGR